MMMITANNKSLDLSRPHVMAILNVTPDSFSDGGKYNSIELALAQVDKMIKAGVSIVDVGGESTRPGAPDVSLEEELRRVVPVIKAIREKYDVWISVDTSKAEVMRQAIDAGADLINDIRSLQEPGALEVAAEANLPICLMHMKGQPRTMQVDPHYDDLMGDVSAFLEERIAACEAAGIDKSQLILDPGFGFGKTIEHNYHMLAHLEKFHEFGLPILAGMSRKSMIFKLLDKPAAECTNASVVCATIAAMKGAQIIRVHDFEETIEAMKVVEMTKNNI
ncbi:sulfonamide-resistant dihydropteroate synthase Sul2 [Vibrio alginolyticus]|jgi:dihydropteroate synthase|uniref:Dihydropteroate synthase n=7 Tax=Vibrio harveyi group TaxID=717610 RepID=A0A1W6TER4_VIBAL|nr:dihydropteroate synthase [Vibrio alginolyticus NBRC 15630 = ATCC 17749]ARO99483.1 sulfonamide-resistant dihydropteroate synthase Sul2 [Vibrio alginolyticus]EEZ81383.1 dihydropteroate synthase [Vibrio alginolyticus 40B]ARP04199.1 sulfonamide-resistant dihydropteroate synthase Sul2 [Vibrio alginolyticus]ARP09256.1 sulfonamide-resistant dihydropteroate synthase Sul2 [Vibrio alginolyticus]